MQAPIFPLQRTQGPDEQHIRSGDGKANEEFSRAFPNHL